LKNFAWVKQGLKNKSDADPINDFKKILRSTEEPGEVLKSLERSLKLLEYLKRAQDANEYFPSNLKKILDRSLGAFKTGILAREEDKL
jgi:hypothetical protein